MADAVNDVAPKQGDVAEVFRTFLRLGLTSFGGPVAHIGYFRKELVERQQWLSESQFSQLLAICQFLPGPASSQLGFALGLTRAGWLGAITAFLTFTLPSAILLFLFAALLPYFSSSVGAAAIHGLKLVACAVVADAVWGMSKKLCPDLLRRSLALFAACIVLLAGAAWAQILVVIIGALVGIIWCRESGLGANESIRVPYSAQLGLALFAVFVFLMFFLSFATDTPNLYSIAHAFYQAGALVFGGGHVVLPLLQDSVVSSGWISREEFLAGYGAAQAIPGPMFTFAAYLGAIIPVGAAGGVAALVALFFMFLPGFLLVAAALPLWQSIAQNSAAASAIAGVNAAIVGILGAALYDPIFTSGITASGDLAIVLIGFAMLNFWQRSALQVVLWCLFASVMLQWLS